MSVLFWSVSMFFPPVLSSRARDRRLTHGEYKEPVSSYYGLTKKKTARNNTSLFSDYIFVFGSNSTGITCTRIVNAADPCFYNIPTHKTVLTCKVLALIKIRVRGMFLNTLVFLFFSWRANCIGSIVRGQCAVFNVNLSVTTFYKTVRRGAV